MSILSRRMATALLVVVAAVLLPALPSVDALNSQNPPQGASGKANLFRNEQSSTSTTARHFKTTYEFGYADQLIPEPLGINQHKMLSPTDFKTQKQLENFVEGRWRRSKPEKSFGEKMLGRTYVIDPYGPSTEIEHQVRTFEDEIEDDEYRLYIGQSFGEKITERNYKVDPHGHSEMKADTEFKPHKFKYYSMLGLDNLASQDEIRNSYRRLVKLYHPGKYLDWVRLEDHALEHYATLTSPFHHPFCRRQSRQGYDRTIQFAQSRLRSLDGPHLESPIWYVYNSMCLANRITLQKMRSSLSPAVFCLFLFTADKYGRKGLGTSAASDKLKVTGQVGENVGFRKKIIGSYKVVKADAGDVKWKGSHGGPAFQVVSFGTAPLRERTLGSSRDQNSSPMQMVMAVAYKKPPMRDLYQVLSVPRQANLDEIQHAYKVLSKRYDPGKNERCLEIVNSIPNELE
jgi:DnaJ-domain-containing protein 1